MSYWKNYYLAKSVSEALQVLQSGQGMGLPIAGGTDLLLDIQQGRCEPVDTLVDLNSIPELTCLEIRQDQLFIGAGLPLCQVLNSPLVQKHSSALIEACQLIGGPQVRNTATLGGNVAHALPAADGSIALFAMNATAEVATLAGRRVVPIADLYLGPGRSALDRQNELLVGFYIPLHRPGQGSTFMRVMRPQGVALPVLNMAVWLWRKPGGLDSDVISDIRIVVGPAGPVPRRAFTVEAFLKEKSLTGAVLAEAEEIMHVELTFRSSPHRASSVYRQHLAASLLIWVLPETWSRSIKNL